MGRPPRRAAGHGVARRFWHGQERHLPEADPSVAEATRGRLIGRAAADLSRFARDRRRQGRRGRAVGGAPGDMLRQVGEAPLDPTEVIRYARANGALVIFDGLDEVTNKLTSAEAQALYRTILRIVPEEDWRRDRDARLAKVGGPGFARSGAKSNG